MSHIFQNWALQATPWLKPPHWGLISSCRDVRKSDGDGTVLYQGAWFRKRQLDFGIIAAILHNGIEWVQQCYTDCMSADDRASCLVNQCHLLLHFEGEVGSCYPARCSPAEIIISTVEGSFINNTSSYPIGVFGPNSTDYLTVKYTDANNGLWVVVQIISL